MLPAPRPRTGMDKSQTMLYTPALRGCFFILRAAEGTPGRVPCEIMSTGAPRGAPRRLPLLSRRRGACFFSSVSPRGCPRALPFSAVVPFADPDRFRFPFLPPFFLSVFSFRFCPRFPAFPLQIRSVFAGKNNGAEPYFRLRPAEMMSFFSFVVPLFAPARKIAVGRAVRVTDSRLLPCVGIVL